MKHLMLCMALAPLVAFAQPTTEEEYNYLSKGYRATIEQGLDLKKGYSMTMLDTVQVTMENVKRIVEFHGFFRAGASKPCALLCIMRRKDSNFVGYTCLPSYDASDAMWKRALEDIQATYGDNKNALGTVLYAHLRIASMGFTQ